MRSLILPDIPFHFFVINEQIGLLRRGELYRRLEEEPVNQVDGQQQQDEFHIASGSIPAKVRHAKAKSRSVILDSQDIRQDPGMTGNAKGRPAGNPYLVLS